MPSSIVPDYGLYDTETKRLLQLCGSLTGLTFPHQKLIAEIILLRLFSLFENFVASIAEKLACGASYIDGDVPVLLQRARSSGGAKSLFQTFGRPKPRNLTWNKASEIKENIKYVIDPNENFTSIIDRNGSLIDELRRVRNRIAHNNTQSRKNYSAVVRRRYGAYMNHITPGLLLLTPRFHPVLIEEYIKKTRILAKEIVKGPS